MSSLIRCSGCATYEEALFRQLKTCPSCGNDLLARIAEHEEAWVERADEFDAHPAQAAYATTNVTRQGPPLVHDARDVFSCARGLIEVAQEIVTFATPDVPNTCVLGFLTGSEGLTWIFERRAVDWFAERFRFAAGGGHGDTNIAPDRELFDQLNAWAAAGMRRLVIIDEFVGGGSLRGSFRRVREWYTSQPRPPLDLHIVAVQEMGNATSFKRKVLRGDAPVPGFTVTYRVIDMRHILTLHKDGNCLKSIGRRQAEGGSYVPNRMWRGRYEIHCPHRLTIAGCTGAAAIWSAASTDQVFGALVYAVCGFAKEIPERWPDTILRFGCPECREALAEARAQGEHLTRSIALWGPSPVRPLNEDVKIVRVLNAKGRMASFVIE